MSVAFIALLAALSGTAVALPGAGSVDSGDLRNNTIRSRDLRNNEIRTQDVRNNSLTGTDVNESTLGVVPGAAFARNAIDARNAVNAVNATRAATAGSAGTAGDAATVEGQAVKTFFVEVPNNSPTETLFDFGGLKLEANCASGNTNVDAENSSAMAGVFQSHGYETGGVVGAFGEEVEDFSGSNGADLTPGAAHAGSGSGTATVLFEDASTVTVVFGYRADGFDTADACRYWGRVITG